MIYVVVCQSNEMVSVVAVAFTMSAAVEQAELHREAMGMWKLNTPDTESPTWGGDDGENMWIEAQEPVDNIVDAVAEMAEPEVQT